MELEMLSVQDLSRVLSWLVNLKFKAVEALHPIFAKTPCLPLFVGVSWDFPNKSLKKIL